MDNKKESKVVINWSLKTTLAISSFNMELNTRNIYWEITVVPIFSMIYHDLWCLQDMVLYDTTSLSWRQMQGSKDTVYNQLHLQHREFLASSKLPALPQLWPPSYCEKSYHGPEDHPKLLCTLLVQLCCSCLVSVMILLPLCFYDGVVSALLSCQCWLRKTSKHAFYQKSFFHYLICDTSVL